jgi:hypothetical protein
MSGESINKIESDLINLQKKHDDINCILGEFEEKKNNFNFGISYFII